MRIQTLRKHLTGRLAQATLSSVAEQQGKYRIDVVSRRTGLKPSTLRAWERRYGVPTPRRTDSSYRLYSDNDISLIRRLIALREQGLSASQAAEALLREESRAEERSVETSAEPAVAVDDYTPIRAMLLDAVHRYDPQRFREVLTRACGLGSATTISREVLMPVMEEIGARWQAGEFSIGQEHMASELVASAAGRLIDMLQPPEATAPIVILASFADEQHAMPLTAVAIEAASSGLRPVLLGARTPAEAIAQAVQRLSPGCVGLSITTALSPERARILVGEYGDACGDVPWIVGGRKAASIGELVLEHGGRLATSTSEISVGEQLRRLALS